MNRSVFVLIFLCFYFLFLSVQSKAVQLSENAEITILTASQGEELYSVFGHSAIRVIDPQNDLDMVFNYGTFDFNTPNFYLKFVRGKLLYKVSAYPTRYFLPEYKEEGRAVFEQVLNLNTDQKQRFFEFLNHNAKPENAYYHYDFFYDNCATRIRDITDTILDPSWAEYNALSPEVMAGLYNLYDFQFNYYKPDTNQIRSFRQMLKPLLTSKPWSEFGIDIALGLPADLIADYYDFMYLPDELLIAFEYAKKSDGEPLVSESRIILPLRKPLSPPNALTPITVFWMIFVLALILTLVTKEIPRKIFDLVFFNSLGLVGALIIFLWFFTDHITTSQNLNILWALPTHLYFIWAWYFSTNRSVILLYFKLVAILSLTLLLAWYFIPQQFHPAFFPVILTSAIRSANLAFPELFKKLSVGKTKITSE